MRSSYTILVFILCLAFIYPFLALSFFNHPSADDYLAALPAMEWGPITSTLGWYFSWSSRYTSSFLISINPIVYKSLVGYQLTTWFLIFLLILSFYNWYKSTSRVSSSSGLFVLAVLSLITYLSTLPSVVEGFYYLNGSMCYQPANALLLLLVSWWFKEIPFRNLLWEFRSFLILGTQCFILFLLAGTNEMAMLFSLSLSGGLWLYRLIKDRKWHPGLLILFFTSLLSTALVIFSPATFYRMKASSSMQRDFLDVLINAGSGFVQFFLSWLSNPPYLLFSIAVLFIPVSKKVPEVPRYWLWTLSVLSILLSGVCFVPSFLGEGVVQGRTANAILFNFLFLYLINVVFWKRSLTDVETIDSESQINQLGLILLLGTVLIAFNSPNFKVAFSDLFSGEASSYNQERLNRIQLVESSANDSIWVQTVQHRPKTIFFGEIGDYPQPWYDSFYARYHGKKFIQLVGPGKSKQPIRNPKKDN
jgi:hypothetical protein